VWQREEVQEVLLAAGTLRRRPSVSLEGCSTARHSRRVFSAVISPRRLQTIGAPGFVPVLLAEDSTAPTEAVGRMEIAFGPAVVRVGADVDAAALRRVLEVVRGLP
jgi:hypothetical protein